jgi:hypothetical protein
MKISEDGKQCNWELNGKKYVHQIIGISNAEVGNDIDERPIIEMDIAFAGKTYKEVQVSLVNRTDKSTKFLVNRKFMERIGCSVSPYKTFVVTSFDGEYHPGEAKGSAHAGITFENKKTKK